jgi:hypothetical protein
MRRSRRRVLPEKIGVARAIVIQIGNQSRMLNRKNSVRFVIFGRTFCINVLALSAATIWGTTAWAEDLNTLTSQEKADGWQLLFDGKTTAGWRGHGRQSFPTNDWEVEDGCLRTFGVGDEMGSRGEDLVTTKKFGDFDLSFDWKISPGGNSGVKYFVIEPEKGRSGLGFEYQILDDDKNPDGKRGLTHQAGALYDLIGPSDSKVLKPVGEFNHSLLIVRGNHLEHWLNGAKIVDADISSQEMTTAIANSKYKNIKKFGQKSPTVILLQEHGSDVWFRNLKIRPLADQ